MPKVDADQLVQQMIEKTKNFCGEVASLPKHLLKAWLAAVVSKVVVDMETKAIEIHVQLPKAMPFTGLSAEKAMRLATTSASSMSCETHPLAAMQLSLIECQFQKASNRLCYECHRHAA
jgi:hypothetical protein